MKPLKELIAGEIAEYIGPVPPEVIKEVPPTIGGDFSLPCFSYAKRERKSPADFARELAALLHGGVVERAEAVNGFLNIYLNVNLLADILFDALSDLRSRYGSLEKKKRRIILEHTSANPNAPLHVGHLRNSIIGDSMVRILRFAGHDVEAQFFVNDMGGQLALLASFLDDHNYKEDLRNSGKKPDAWLGEMYVEANREVDPEVAKALQKNYERGSEETRKIFDFIVDTALRGFRQTFADYGVEMDTYVRESEFVFGGAVEEVIQRLRKSKEWFERDGVEALDLTSYGIKKELVLMRSDGTTLYTTRDIAYHLWKLKQGDCINVIANEQTLQQQQLRAALSILGIKDVEERVKHLAYELVTVPGMRMSSRTGEFISADDLLQEGIKRVMDEVERRGLKLSNEEKEEISRAIAVGAIRFNMVKITPLKPIVFRWDEALNLEGESAPYLQYSHARACRILEKSTSAENPDPIHYKFNEFERELIILLYRFPEVIQESATSLKPNILAGYLLSLAEAFNRFYLKCPVLDSKRDVMAMRLSLVRSFKQVMATGLGLLGIKPLERM